MVPKITPVWFFCQQCEDWVGSKPPLLPWVWSNEKSAAMHVRGTKHEVTKVTVNDLVVPEKEDKNE